MPLSVLLSLTGVKGLRKVGENTVVVEYNVGWVRPASALEIVLWDLLTTRAAS